MANIGTPILNLPQALMLNGTEWVPLVQGGTTMRAKSAQVGQAYFTAAFPASIEYVMFGGGTQLATGRFGTGLTVPFNCNITQGTVLLDRIGSISVDIWKCTESQYDAGATHPGPGDSITGSNNLVITASTKVQDGNLTGWTKSLTAGDILWFDIASVNAAQIATVSLQVSRNVSA